MGQLRSPSGEIVTVPDDQVEHAIAGGYTPVSTTEAGQSTGAITQEDTGALGAVGAGLSSLASGATLGLSDLAAKGLLNRGHFEDLALQREQHPVVSGIGQVAGTVLPSLLAPGSTLAAAPAGLLSRAAVGATEQFGGGLAAKAVVGAGEGALYNAGAYLSDTALGDRDLTAEGLSGALGAGFAFGAAGAVGMHGVEAGTIAARRMFARVAEGGEKAALDASSAWERASQSTLEANDAAADAARAKLAEAKLATQQAGVARDQAAARVATERAAAPGADAEFSQARILDENIAKVEASEAQAAVPGPEVVIGNHEDLANLLAEHDAARADFERVLASLQAPEVGQVGGRIEKTAGKFGEPELAAGTPAPVSIRDALDARARQVEATSVGRRPAATLDVNANSDSGSLEDLLRGTKAQIDSGKSLGEVAGRPPLADVPASAPGPRTTAPSSVSADNSLESMLAGTKAKLDEGQSLGEIASGSKLRKDYVTSKRLEVGKPLTEGPLATASTKSPATAVPEYAVVKAHETKLDAELEQTLPASAIAERGYYEPPGGHNDVVRTANAKKAIAEGQQEAIKLNVTPSGKITVTNGRHRLQAAIEADAPIKVKWSTGFEPSAELDVFRGGAKAAEAAHAPAPYDPGADLEALLAKHVAERDGAVAKGFPATAKGDVESFPAGDAPLDSSYEFSVKQKHTGDTPLKLSVGTKPSKFGGPPRVLVKVERIAKDGEVMYVGDAELFHRPNGDLYPESVNVDGPFHRLGIATRMYEAAEEASGGKLIPSENQTEMGAAFSKKFRRARDAAPVEGGSFKDAAPDRTSHFDIKSSDLEFDPKMRTYRDKDGALNPLGYRQPAATARDPALEQAMRAADEAHPFAAKQLEQRLDAAHDLATHAPDATTRQAALAEAATIERQLTVVGARPGAVEDVALVAKVATRYEKASAALTEALGTDAPPAAQEAAKAFRAAESTAERKTMDRTTRSIDDANDPPVQVGKDRRPGSLKSSAERINAAKQEKLNADATLAQARAGESEARLGSRAADLAAKAIPTPTGTTDAKAKVGGVLGKLRTVGTALEVASDFGVPGVPHPKDIPVIGPLLSVYLKYRALKAAAGRFTGRVPATAEARAAALAAKTKDKIARAVDRSLGLVERAAGSNAGQRGAVAASARIGATLSRRAFDDGEPDAPKDATTQQQAAVRIREVANAATQPQLVIAQVRREMRHVTDPDLIAAAEKHQVALYTWLNTKMPKAPPPNPFSTKPWEPSPAAASRAARMLEVAHDPHAAFEALAQQSLTPEAAETFQRGYPLLFGMAQSRMIERAADVEHPIPYQTKLRNGLLFKVALDPSAEPATLSLLQTAHVASSPGPAASPAAPPGTPPVSALAAPTNLTALYQTGSDRRAMR